MPKFNGSDYDPNRDDYRLSQQMGLVWDLMVDGKPRTLWGISQATGAPEASVSAQLRHLRKPKFGGHLVAKEYVGNGLYEYTLVPRVQSCAVVD